MIMSPEALDNFKPACVTKQLHIALIAIDECHLVMGWGTDTFRPAFKEAIKQFREFLQDKQQSFLPVLLLSATVARADEAALFELVGSRGETAVVRRTVRRTNVTIRAFMKTQFADDMVHIKSIIDQNTHEGGGTIIYRKTIKDCQTTVKHLVRLGLCAGAYHGSPSNSNNTEIQAQRAANQAVQQRFQDSKLEVVVATISFGMGIHRSDVRLVINYDAPTSNTEVIQMGGRAGRDGKPAEHLIFYQPNSSQ